MSADAAHLAERLSAARAAVGLLLRVDRAVPLQVARRDEAFAAQRAAVAPLPGVDEQVHTQVVGLGEALATVRAGIGPLTRVHPLVQVQGGSAGEDPSANGAHSRVFGGGGAVDPVGTSLGRCSGRGQGRRRRRWHDYSGCSRYVKGRGKGRHLVGGAGEVQGGGAVQSLPSCLCGKGGRRLGGLATRQTQLGHCVRCTKMSDPLLHPSQVQAQASQAVRAWSGLVRGHVCRQPGGQELLLLQRMVQLNVWL